MASRHARPDREEDVRDERETDKENDKAMAIQEDQDEDIWSPI
jgi:hypothetical protein